MTAGPYSAACLALAVHTQRSNVPASWHLQVDVIKVAVLGCSSAWLALGVAGQVTECISASMQDAYWGWACR